MQTFKNLFSKLAFFIIKSVKLITDQRILGVFSLIIAIGYYMYQDRAFSTIDFMDTQWQIPAFVSTSLLFISGVFLVLKRKWSVAGVLSSTFFLQLYIIGTVILVMVEEGAFGLMARDLIILILIYRLTLRTLIGEIIIQTMVDSKS